MYQNIKGITALVIICILFASCNQSNVLVILPNETETPTISPTATNEDPTILPSPTTLQPALPTEEQTIEQKQETDIPAQPSPTQEVPSTPLETLAFLNQGNLYVFHITTQELLQLTNTGDILSYTWKSQGNGLVVFNGYRLCQVSTEDFETINCIDLGFNDLQATVMRQISLSPDDRYAAIWNPFYPWEEEAIGWLVVDLINGDLWRVLDPVDWGAQLAPDNEPGGVTGQALFLQDGMLIGTITHRWLCTGTAGCRYQLFSFDFINRTMIPFDNKPEDGFSEGLGLVLSQDGRLLLNHGTFHAGCEAYITFVDVYDLQNGERRIYDLDQVAVNGLALAPTNQQAVISRNAGCSTENQTEWAQSCGLIQGFDLYNMQLWNLVDETRTDLPPGTQPDWSPGGQFLAFRSCLTEQADGGWKPNGNQNPAIYIYDFNIGALFSISEGDMAKWKP